MIYAQPNLSVSFDTGFGRFSIDRDPQREQIFVLSLQTKVGGQLILGDYCSLSDAICAVSQQRTGYQEWDRCPADEVPNRVHDIASWKFQQIHGTLPQRACS